MKRGCAIAVMICGLITSVSAASAADLIVQEPVFEPLPQPALAGWYLRGDIGYNFKSKTGGKWDFWNQFEEPYRGVDDTFNYDDFSLKGGASYGVGVGYRFNDMLRTDLTLDYFRASINGRTNCPSYVKSSHGLNPVEDNCHYEDNSKASVWTAMANAYVDLPRVGPLTPYLGAGIGAAYVKYDTWKTSEICPTCTLQSDKDGFDSWRFAMALMAGVSYDLTDQLKLTSAIAICASTAATPMAMTSRTVRLSTNMARVRAPMDHRPKTMASTSTPYALACVTSSANPVA